MIQRARKFIDRAPRYILRPQDRSDMRFSLEHSQGGGGIEKTLLLNLSESGCAFVVDGHYAPKTGDRIKVEIPIPQGDRIAWWGRVVRTEYFHPRIWFFRSGFDEDTRIVVALRFERLPEPFSQALRRGLNRSFLRAMRDQEFVTFSYYRAVLRENSKQVLLYAALIFAAIATMYVLTLPSDNYDPNRGAPWGERFKFF